MCEMLRATFNYLVLRGDPLAIALVDKFVTYERIMEWLTTPNHITGGETPSKNIRSPERRAELLIIVQELTNESLH